MPWCTANTPEARGSIAPLGPGFDLDRYDRELRSPFPSRPQYAPESKVWRREHAIADAGIPAAPEQEKVPITATSRGFIPTVIVPLLLITHGLTFRILLQHQPERAMQESRHLA